MSDSTTQPRGVARGPRYSGKRKRLVRLLGPFAFGAARPAPRHARPGRAAGSRSVAALRGRRVIVVAAGVPMVVLVVAIPFAMRTSASTSPRSAAGWSTVFNDSFSGMAGSGPGPAWTYDTGTQYRGTGCAGNWGTGEVERGTASTANVSEDGTGHLNITPVDSNGTWTSGRIETAADDFAAPAGGKMEVSASIRQPSPADGVGYWPAFWMLGAGFRAIGAGTSGTMDCSSWPSTGEIDVMEDVNAQSRISGTLHCGTDPGGPCNETTGLGSGLQRCADCQTGYNTYSVIINRSNPSNESITWYLNGNAYHTVTESLVGTTTWQEAVDHGFFLVLDVAIGGSYPDGICGCTAPTAKTTSGAGMSVSYVSVSTSNRAVPAASPSPQPPPCSPASGTATPGSGTATPGSGTATPGSGTATPGSGTATPGSGTATPGRRARSR